MKLWIFHSQMNASEWNRNLSQYFFTDKIGTSTKRIGLKQRKMNRFYNLLRSIFKYAKICVDKRWSGIQMGKKIIDFFEFICVFYSEKYVCLNRMNYRGLVYCMLWNIFDKIIQRAHYTDERALICGSILHINSYHISKCLYIWFDVRFRIVEMWKLALLHLSTMHIHIFVYHCVCVNIYANSECGKFCG